MDATCSTEKDTRTVIVVEDDEGLNNLISRALQKAGIQTTSALEGASAIEKITSNGDMILVLDYQLPDMTGKQVVEKLIELDQVIPFIMVTGQGDEKTAVEMMKLGARDYLVKDTGFMDNLPRVVKRVLEQLKTEQRLKQAEIELEQSRERFRRMGELLPFPMWFVTMDGQTEYINPQFTSLFGYTVDDIPTIAEWFDLAFHNDHEREVATDHWKTDRITINNQEPIKREYEVECKNGATIIVTVRFLGIGLQTIFMVFHDITESKRAEQKIRDQYDEIEVHAYELESSNAELKHTQEKLIETNHELKTTLDELKSSQEQLLQSAKLAAIGELVSGVGHELNKPLSAVAMHIELLASKTDYDEMQKHIDTISTQTERAISIVQNLVSFSRKQEPQKELVSVNEAVESCVALRSYDLNIDNIEVILELDHTQPKSLADTRQLQQVFLNLINNAAQSMSEVHKRGRLIIQSYIVGDMIRTSFTDDGPGIPPDKKDRIFEPFFTTKSVGKATGLGLSICYGIVEGYGGCIYAESTEGNGATFTVELPLTHESFE